MKFHLATHRVLDFEAMSRDAEQMKCPRPFMWLLAQRLRGEVHQPDGAGRNRLDVLRAKVVGRPEHWALARSLAPRVGRDDLIYCPGEEIGFPMAATCGARRDRPKVVVFANNVDRPRARAALRLFRLRDRVDLFVTNASTQADFLREALRLPDDRLLYPIDHTDTRFFTPGPSGPAKARPIIASVGLERRDYRTLAQATHDLDVDVRISGFSKDAAVQARAFPETPPANMSQRFYEWTELLQLYRDADVVVVSLFECRYAAGMTSLLEAMACRRPLVVTRTAGLADFLAPPDAMTTVPPGDPEALRRAVLDLLNDPARAEAQARRGHEMALRRYSTDAFIEFMAGRFNALGAGSPARA